MKILRNLEDLDLSDVSEHPVWVWAYDEEDGDELSVKPTLVTELPHEGEFHVVCRMTTKAGKELYGVLSVIDGIPDPETITVIESAERHWELSAVPPQRLRQYFEIWFGCNYNELFPVKWESLIPVAGGGLLHGEVEQKVRLVEATAQCSFCGGVLRTNRARQCPHCFRSWV